MTDEANRRPVFLLRLRPEPHVTDPVRSLRNMLKAALRRFGMRAISVVQEEEPTQ
jgi:hypothetical protein